MEKLIVHNGTYNLTITSGECYEIAWALLYQLRHSVSTHWVNHLNSNWKEEESVRIARLRTFFELSLYPHLFDSNMRDLDGIISDAKKKAEKSSE